MYFLCGQVYNQCMEDKIAPPPQNQDSVSPSCPSCNHAIETTYNFCPNCGKQLHDMPLSQSVGKQLGIYLLSFFLPPFGLIPAYKYFHSKDSKANIIGIVAIFLTAISLATSTYFVLGVLEKLSPLINSVSTINQMQ